MTTTELRTMFRMAEVVTENGTYRLLDGKGRVVMFGITKERAESYLTFYPGGRVVAENK